MQGLDVRLIFRGIDAMRKGSADALPFRPRCTGGYLGAFARTNDSWIRAKELYAAGFQKSAVHVIGGAHAIAVIDPDNGSAGLGERLTRMTQAVFGMEMEHTERHLAELEAGHFLVHVPSSDDRTTDRINDILAARGGHLIHYYSRWTARQLVP